MSQAEMAEGTGLASREISAAMRSANEADELLDDEADDEVESADEVENRALESGAEDDVKSLLGHPVANG